MNVNFNVLDRMGSLLWSGGGQAVQAFTYSPYGGAPARSESSLLPGFNGERLDPISQTYHLGSGYRTYHPALMRFTAPDSWSPFGAGGLNAYAYCEGDPINRTDPSGHMSWQAGVGVSLGLGLLSILGAIVTGGMSIAAEGGVMAAIMSADATDLVAGGLGLAADVTGIASFATQDSNPKASEILGWISFGLGIAGVGVHAGKMVHGKLKKSAPYELLRETEETHRYPTTCSEIKERGVFLGAGKVGSAYKVDVGAEGAPKYVVYKINHKNPKPFEDPDRVARVWNEFYTSAYKESSPEFNKFLRSNFANAEMVKLNDGIRVLRTPFVDGGGSYNYNFREQITNEMNNLNREMHDLNGGNVEIMQFNGERYAVPVDFDLVISDLSPSRKGSFASNYFHGRILY